MQSKKELSKALAEQQFHFIPPPRQVWPKRETLWRNRWFSRADRGVRPYKNAQTPGRGGRLCPPGKRRRRYTVICGEFGSSQRADVGIGPYETVQICTVLQPRRCVQSKALCAADSTESLPLGSQIVERLSNRYHLTNQNESAYKTRKHSRFLLHCKSGTLGFQKGRGPFVSEGVQRKPFQGFPLGNFFLAARHHSSLRS